MNPNIAMKSVLDNFLSFLYGFHEIQTKSKIDIET